jgi:ABC-type transport system substrate-binding protein
MTVINGFAPAALTPADYWVSFVNNQSAWGNFGAYSNPIVQAAVNAFTSSSNQTYIQQLVGKAQEQLYNDAPIGWIGLYSLWSPAGGSLVWKKGVVTGFFVDPVWSGQTTAPIFNTVTFG